MKKYNYNEVLSNSRPGSYLSYLDNKLASFLVYLMQSLPLNANFLTIVSFIFALLAIVVLLLLKQNLLFIVLLVVAYTFDNIDGIWARLKKQSSKFGAFLDPYLDKVKEYLVDLSFIVFYFQSIIDFIEIELVFIFFILYFIFKSLVYISRDFNAINEKTKNPLKVLTYGPIEKILFVYSLVVFSFDFFCFYFVGHFILYFFYIFIALRSIAKNN